MLKIQKRVFSKRRRLWDLRSNKYRSGSPIVRARRKDCRIQKGRMTIPPLILTARLSMANPTAINNMVIIPMREIFDKSIKMMKEMSVKNVTLYR